MEPKRSSFQYKRPKLKTIEFETLDIVSKDEDIRFDIPLSMEHSIQKEESQPIAVVAVRLIVGDKKQSRFYLEVIMEAEYKWQNDVEEEDLQTFLSKNAVALILSHMRVVVNNLCAESGFPFELPYFDLT